MTTDSMTQSDSLSLLRGSGQVHSGWYRAQYPDVPATGLHPAEHYLRYGAAMGRNPRPGFDTRYYLTANPEIAARGINPLVHYIQQGAKEGRRTAPPRAAENAEDAVEQIRYKLQSLGFTDRPLSELRGILAREGASAALRARAAHVLALWQMRARSRKGHAAALEHIAQAQAQLQAQLQAQTEAPTEAQTEAPTQAGDHWLRSRLATIELLCHHHLGQSEEGRAAFLRAGQAGLVTPDLLLAWANFHKDPQTRLLHVNFALRRHGIPELALLPDEGKPLYDRLTAAAPLPAADGPRVSVLVAAHAAGATLPTALRALQEQTWANLEIIVLDDCSPDDTAGVAERLAATDPRIRLHRMERNGGAYVARNAGLDLATGDYVTLHDADDWAHPKRIETQVRFLEENAGVMGCTSEQARAFSDLGFTRWTGAGHFITPNISSFMFRRAPMRERLGYWDTARFSADRELMRRMKRSFGARSVVEIRTGPLAFQRDSDSSIVADEALGINGFIFGARKEYLDAQTRYHETGGSLRYAREGARAFPIPAIMRTGRDQSQTRHFDVVIASDFRMDGGSLHSCIQEIRAARAGGFRVGVFEMFRYDLGARARRSMFPALRDEIDGEAVQVLTYGEAASCDLLVLRYPPILQHRQRYVPGIDAKHIKVIVNQPPMSDYSTSGQRRYDLARCVRNIRHYFGKDAIWHPNGPMVREALLTHHADELAHVALASENWDNIIDLAEWQRPLEAWRPGDRLRIGRHSRDSALKWPDTAEDILAAYPAAEDVEVHVLGGASAPAALIGEVPPNWVVHGYDAQHPGEFLAGIDVFVFFSHPDWVESFPRTVLEAMATGVPVILPESHRPLFGDAAIYATPQTALEAARRLHADPQAYAAQVRRAWTHLEAHYSYAMHARRIKDLI